MEIIKDGKGRGYQAAVDEHNRLTTFATIRNRISFISEEHESAFISYAKRDFVSANTNEVILYFEYTGNTKCFIDSITFSTSSSSAIIEVYVLPIYVSGGTEREPLNLNRGAGNTSNVTSIIGVSGTDGELTVTVADNEIDEILDVRLGTGQPTFTYDFRGGLILERGNKFALIGKVASAGDKIRAAVYYFEEPSV